jgi:hypothetical protein
MIGRIHIGPIEDRLALVTTTWREGARSPSQGRRFQVLSNSRQSIKAALPPVGE